MLYLHQSQYQVAHSETTYMLFTDRLMHIAYKTGDCFLDLANCNPVSWIYTTLVSKGTQCFLSVHLEMKSKVPCWYSELFWRTFEVSVNRSLKDTGTWGTF